MEKGKLARGEFVEMEDRYIKFVEAFGLENELEMDVHAVRDRQGIFSFALTVWLMLLQRFNPKHSLSGALEELINGGADQVMSKIRGSKKVRLRKISLNSGGYSQARSRVPLKMISKLVEFVTSQMSKIYGGAEIEGEKVYLLDGTGMAVGNYEEVTKSYPRQRTQYGPQKYPYMRVVFAHNLANGMAVYPAHGTLKQSEQELSIGVPNRLPNNALVIADRNFGIYSVTYHALQAGVQTLTRLNDVQANKLSKSPGDIDEEIIWHAPKTSNKGTHKALIGTLLRGRVIRRTIQRAGFRPLVLNFFTTSKLSPDKLAQMYLSRERIENDIRDIKHTLSLQVISSKSADIIEKELLLGVLAYNLIRATIADTARKIGLEPRQISFSRSISVIRIMHNKIRQAKDQSDLNVAYDWFLTAMRQIQIYKRRKKRPAQPRKIMTIRSRRYPIMKKSRNQEVADINPHFVI